jgi:hypothetical protein
MNTPADKARRVAQWIIGYMSLGPFVAGLDLVFHLFPARPGIEVMRNSGFYAHSLWLGCGVLGIAAIILLRVRPRYGYVALAVLTAAYVPVSSAVWHQSIMLHYWLSLAAIALGTYGVFAGRQHALSETE